MGKLSIFWFRRDLRLDDNTGLLAALKGGVPIMPIFIFDSEILDALPQDDPRISFIYKALQKINNELRNTHGSSLAMFKGKPTDIFLKLIKTHEISTVYTNHDYEPYAIKRDTTLMDMLKKNGTVLKTYKDQVIFERNEIVKDDGNPYVVYTPFMRRWKQKFNPEQHLNIQNTLPYLNNFVKNKELPNLTLLDIGFKQSSIVVPEYNVSPNLIGNYEKTRNIPSINGTSKLGPYLRFGTVSIRKILKKAIIEKNETFWNELIWREFFMQILWHFPYTLNEAFKKKYNYIKWRNNEEEFEKWKNGQTGYPFIDSGMRELNKTGFMHNRVRMLTASFLCKHLLIDWRWGEAYFAEKLVDYEMASNVGNWQWAAGSGVDAAPYFRIFNPITQVDKFDKDKKYIQKWVPELQELSYPSRMVDHKLARERCLTAYKKALV